MPTSGDIYDVDLGTPVGHEAGGVRPAIVVSAQRVLDGPTTELHLVPLSTAIRDYESEVLVVADDLNGLDADSAAQCQHVRAVSGQRRGPKRGNVGPEVLTEVREVIADLLDLPG